VPERLPQHALQPAAAHFAKGCAICHGAPGEPRSPAALGMLPKPPDLTFAIPDWTDAELFRIVKHGIRFTGMPAWPNQKRDDEVWAMVAFLRELPAMPPSRYRELAYGAQTESVQPSGLEHSLADCARCHGRDGLGRSNATPIIAGQKEAYLVASLTAYQHGLRPSGFMALPAAQIDDADRIALARYFAGLSVKPARNSPSDTRLAAKGKVLATEGDRSRNIPACLSCHGDGDRNLAYPVLDGQPEEYLAQQLRLFRAATRGGSAYGKLMATTARELTDDDIEALAAFFSQ